MTVRKDPGDPEVHMHNASGPHVRFGVGGPLDSTGYNKAQDKLLARRKVPQSPAVYRHFIWNGTGKVGYSLTILEINPDCHKSLNHKIKLNT